MWLLSLINPLTSIAREIAKVKLAQADAATEQRKAELDAQLRQLEARERVLIAEQGSYLTRWIRPAIALPVVIYIWKIVVIDTVLGWGVTPDPGNQVNWLVLTVVGAYFLTRPIEKALRRNS